MDLFALANSLVLKNPRLYVLLFSAYSLSILLLGPISDGFGRYGQIVRLLAWIFFIGPVVLAVSRDIVCNDGSRPHGFRALMIDAVTCWWPNIRASFFLWILMLGLGIALMPLIFLLENMDTMGSLAENPLFPILHGAVLLLMCFAMLYVIFRLSLGYACLADGLGGARDAFKRSLSLTQGRLLRLIPLYLLLSLISLAGFFLAYVSLGSSDVGIFEIMGMLMAYLLIIYGLLLVVVTTSLVYVSLRGVESASALVATSET